MKKLFDSPILVFVFILLGDSLPALTQTQLSEGPVFVDVTAQSGIMFQHSFGDDDMSNILESTGSGCAFFDYDGDGHLDIYAVSGCYLDGINDIGHKGLRLTNHLYRNNGDGTFTDVTEQAGVGDEGYGMGCVVGDYDNDGDPDLYVTNYGPNTLYRNNGDGTFRDVTEEAGVGDTLWGVGAVFFDYNNDGYLDLYVGNYLEFDPEYRLYYEADEFPGPLAYPGQRDVLYRNNGDGTFTDVTEAAGVLNEGRAMGVLSSDYDDDGWVDLFVANDAMENYLYRNNGDGTFTEVGLESGTAFSEHGDAASSMGGDFADFDLDGDLDLLVPDMTFNSFYRNLGHGFFEDVSAQIGVAEISGQYWSWGGDLFDYDNDGDLDIFISNGDGHRLDTQEELFLANVPGPKGERVFKDVAGQSGEFFRHKSVSRGMAVGDYDNDGDLDVFILNLDQPSILLRNDGGNRNHWLMIQLRGTKSNRDGVGARVTLRTGDLKQVEEKKTGTGYLSQNDPRLHFGLGDRRHIEKVVIRWPSGVTQRLTNIDADKIMTVIEPVD
ncbi:MAG: CRTAC1 family protein [bacterium]